jgi:DNA-binding CsgD family transcriptional regulator
VRSELALTAEEILELVRSRSSPGVLILDLNNKLLYSNQEALSLLNNLEHIPAEVQRLCNEVKAYSNSRKAGTECDGNCALLWRGAKSPCSLRAFPIGAKSKRASATHVMVLVEKVTEQHGLNLKKAKTKYGLSDREIEVVALVAQGLANKEIAPKLFVSEHTVKDHIKNIMRKMNAASRSEIIYLLK